MKVQEHECGLMVIAVWVHRVICPRCLLVELRTQPLNQDSSCACALLSEPFSHIVVMWWSSTSKEQRGSCPTDPEALYTLAVPLAGM